MNEQERKVWENLVAHCSPAQKFLYEDDEEIDRAILAADAELTTLRRELEEKGAMLCAAREALEAVRSSVNNTAGAFVGYINLDEIIDAIFCNTVVLCRQEEEARRLREAVGWASDEITMVRFGLPLIWKAELRRRAKEGK